MPSISTTSAVVIGGSIAGLLAARVLSDSHATVIVLDRDDLPAGHEHRKGVPQSRHAHGLLARGRQIFDELLPGFSEELTALGAIPSDLQNDTIWYNDGHRATRAPSDLQAILASRPLIEGYIRDRVAALPNVEVRSNVEVTGLLAANDTITGVRLADGTTIDARVVVDATGRSNRGPTWLGELGYPAVPEASVLAGLVYVSREYRRDPATQTFHTVIIGHHPANPVGTGTVSAEGDRWLVTLLGVEPNTPPVEPGAFEDFAAGLDGLEVHDLISTAEPLTEPTKFRIGPSVRRRYEKCGRLPDGFIAVGDSLACFNPAYGQGMTTAAMTARWLRDCLPAGTDGLTKRFFGGVATIIDVPWAITVGADLRFPQVVGERTGQIKFLNAYLSKLHIAAQTDAVVGATFLKAVNFLIPPARMMAPSMLWRVWRGRKATAAS
jgi:2-polyprenyl-6-methoxyphenol hydroxylase-like FAD-dependent oxidoreductase